MGIAGGDFQLYKNFLEKHEVETKYIKIIDKFETSTAIGITDSSDNQIWGFYMGADSMSDGLSINNIMGPIDLGIIAPQNPKAMLKFAKEYAKGNCL